MFMHKYAAPNLNHDVHKYATKKYATYMQIWADICNYRFMAALAVGVYTLLHAVSPASQA